MKFKNAFDAIADTPGEALNMKIRAELMDEIRARIDEEKWTQAEAAEQLGMTQPRVSDLLRGKLSKFSLDSLVNMLAALGSDVKVQVA